MIAPSGQFSIESKRSNPTKNSSMHLKHNLEPGPRLALIALLILLGLVSLSILQARISEATSFFATTPNSSPRSQASVKEGQIESVPGQILVRFRSDAAAARATIK